MIEHNQRKITDYYKSNRVYKKQSKITDYFKKNKKKVFGYNSATGSNHCTICGKDIGSNNPRQLCYKTWCPEYLF